MRENGHHKRGRRSRSPQSEDRATLIALVCESAPEDAARMEDALNVYTREQEAKLPLTCMDERALKHGTWFNMAGTELTTAGQGLAVAGSSPEAA